MKIVAERIMDSIIHYGLVREEEKEIYLYTLIELLEKNVIIAIIVLFSLLYKVFLPTIFFLIFFFCIRNRAGGFHANTFSICLLETTGVYILFVRVFYPIMLRHLLETFVLLLISVIIIWQIGATNHPNMHWDLDELEETKKIVRRNVLIEYLVIIIGFILEIEMSFLLFMSFSIVLSATLLVIAKIIKQEV